MVVNGDKANQVPLDMSSMVLRGCSLRNTEWAIAMVVFTGNETKVMLNQKQAEFKASHLHKNMDRLISFIMGVLLLGIVIAVVGHHIWLDNNADKQWYQEIKSNGYDHVDRAEI